MIVDQDPTVPNRRDAIAGDAGAVAAVTEHLARMAKRLEDAGADFLVMVCNTAHVFLDGVHAVTTIPFISIIDTTIAEIENRCPETRIVGVMATDGCLDAGIYQRAVEASGRIALVPDAASKARLMSLINRIKAGDQGPDVAAAMQAVAQSLVDAGADVIIGGCTEIPIVFEGDSFSVPVISSTNVLAQKTVDLANGLQALPVK
jgi:aspartate racemase